MSTIYRFFQHPKTGEMYACAYDPDTHTILEAAGPVHDSDAEYERIGDTPSKAESDAVIDILMAAGAGLSPSTWHGRREMSDWCD